MVGGGLGSGDLDDSFAQSYIRVRKEQQSEPLIEPVIRIWLCAKSSNELIQQKLYEKDVATLSHDEQILKLKNFCNPMTKLHTLSDYKVSLLKAGIKFRMLGGDAYDVAFFFVSDEDYEKARAYLPPPMTWAQTCTIL